MQAGRNIDIASAWRHGSSDRGTSRAAKWDGDEKLRFETLYALELADAVKHRMP